MRKNIIFLVVVFVIIALNAFAFAQKKQIEKSFFNVVSANKTFDSIQKILEVHDDYASLVFYTQQIESLQNDAKKCVNNSESNLKIIAELLKTTQVDHITQLQQVDLQYLQGKQLHYAKELSDCRLFLYRSQEALGDYKEKIQKLSAYEILKRGTPIWKIQDNQFLQSLNEINLQKIIAISGIDLVTENQIILGAIFLLFSILIAFYAKTLFKRWFSSAEKSHVLWRGFLLVAYKTVIPVIILGFMSAYFVSIFDSGPPTPSLELISIAAFCLVLGRAVARYLFYPSKIFHGLLTLPDHLGRVVYRHLLYLMLGLFAGFVVVTLCRGQILAPDFVELSRTLYITVLSAITALLLLSCHRLSPENRIRYQVWIFFSNVFLIALAFLTISEWLGYHRFAVFAMTALCFSMLYTVGLMIAWRLVDLLYQWIDNKQYAAARKAHQIFGVKFTKKIHEITIIKFAVLATILCCYAVMLLKSWSISAIFVDSLMDSLLYGFKFLGMTIIPLRIILALISFSVILLFGRFLATTVAKKQHFKGEEDTQIAISTITIYVSFGIALLFAFLVTGVDFTGLAIIAGALSVGVGLGLQTIVNNFVSGLILLIEKPIKPGDRIVIGKTEGFVRKIRIRSTQIATLAKEDVIVPNADLITQQVTNYMFRDRNARVSCEVGVAYGSDLNLVKKILLDVAQKHDDVVHESPNDPVVLFSRFGESALIFTLLCIIHDVNKKYMVVSDLNFAIDAAFREQGIVIAFPQRDLHIRDFTQLTRQ